MTVSYSRKVATTTLGTFARLLFRWKGSIYRLLYREMVMYLTLYYFVCIIYQFALSEHARRKFEEWSLFCQKYTDLVPLTFVLGFYVSMIIGRWWNIFSSLTWPDKICFMVQSLVGGHDERGRMVRRTVARYINLAQVLVLRDISSAVRKRFPTLEILVESGFLTDDEYKQFESIEMTHHKFWVPLQWTCSLLTKARKEGLIDTDPSLVKMIEEVIQCRNSLMSLICYDWISVPLVYTQ
uniref:Bestrophin homolog n=1 Tax=Romanomermis culicivorax TaxID=13658 RepID=A0A915JXE7_ROMCU